MSDPQPPPGMRGTVVRGATLAGVGVGLSQGINFGVYLVLARLVSPADFGIIAAAGLVVGVGLMFAESGMVAALIRREDRVEEAASTALAATLLAGLGLALLAFAVSPLIGAFFESARTGEVAAVMSGFLLLRSATLVPDGLLQRRFSFLRRVVVEPLAVIVSGAAAITACLQGLGVWGLVIGQYASVTTQVVLSFGLARWLPRPSLVSFALWREMAGFGRRVLSGSITYRLAAEIDTALVGRFLGTAALGQYRYAHRFASQPFGALLNVAAYVLFPAFARLSGEPDRFRAGFLKALRWVGIMAVPAGLIFFPLGQPIVLLLLGETWREAGYILMGMCAFTGARIYDALVTEALIAWGRPDIVQRIYLVAVALSLLVMFAFLPLGVVGIATAVSLVWIGVAVYAVRALCRTIELPGRQAAHEIWPPVVAGLVMAGGITALEHLIVHAASRPAAAGLTLLALEALAGMAVYLSVLGLLRPMLAREVAAGLGRALTGIRRRTGPSATKG